MLQARADARSEQIINDGIRAVDEMLEGIPSQMQPHRHPDLFAEAGLAGRSNGPSCCCTKWKCYGERSPDECEAEVFR